jgi:pimeloyl-ACP methyl ester carboxylesterase
MTDPQAGARGPARSLDHGLFLDIHGLPQWITLRGQDLANPVLMVVGGPGAAFTGWAPFFAPWEADFTLVQWDQPGGGATWARSGDEANGPITLERLARDGLCVAEQALARLGAHKLILLGLSGGSIVGLMMIKARPERFSAYVGTGQFVHWARQDALGYAMTLQQARSRGDEAAVAELERIGPPPYADAATDAIKSRHAGALTEAEQAAFAEAGPALDAVQNPPPDAAWRAPGLELPDPRARGFAVYEQVRAELMGFDARRLGLAFEVPIVFLQGAEDAYSVTSVVAAYAAKITAPHKQLVLIEGGGHSAIFMRERFLELLTRRVRPLVG